MVRIKTIILVLLLLLLSTPVWAATVYITQAGAGGETGADCANAKDMAYFNASASGGNTYVVCSGETITTTITPPTGSIGSVITLISEYEHDATGAQYDVQVTISGRGAYLNGVDYIMLDGLYFNDTGDEWITLNDANYNVIQNCKFYDANDWEGIRFEGDSKYNKILDSVFSNSPPINAVNCARPADFIYTSGRGLNGYNVIEGNTFGDAGHAALDILYSHHWVIRDNDFTQQFHSAMGGTTNGLVENNRIYDSGILQCDYFYNGTGTYPNCAENKYRRNDQAGLQNAYDGIIFRKNILDNNGKALHLSSASDALLTGSNGHYYNNTINDSVRLFSIYSDTQTPSNNVIKNNTFSETYSTINGEWEDNACWKDGAYSPSYRGTAFLLYMHSSIGWGGANNIFTNNNFYDDTVDYALFGDRNTAGDYDTFTQIVTDNPTVFVGTFRTTPGFTDVGGRDFTLASDSNLLNAATHLTEVHADDAGTGNTLKVKDAGYFYDGYGITGETGDYVCIGANLTPRLVTDVTVNTMTVTDADARSEDDEIYLASSSTVCYNGSAPDIGALEYEMFITAFTPSSGATGQSITVDGNWTNPTGTTANIIYLDVKATHDPPTTEIHPAVDGAVETHDFGTLAYATEYAWRNDIVHAGGTQTGVVYYFTTTSELNPPTPSGGGIAYNKKGSAIGYSKKGSSIK